MAITEAKTNRGMIRMNAKIGQYVANIVLLFDLAVIASKGI